jgi:hypothetical protein
MTPDKVDAAFEMINGALFVVGLYAMAIFARYMWRAGFRRDRASLADAICLHVVGHTVYRAGAWLNWHAANNHIRNDWISSLWILRDLSAVLIGISLLWMTAIMATAMYSIEDDMYQAWIIPIVIVVVGTALLYFLP